MKKNEQFFISHSTDLYDKGFVLEHEHDFIELTYYKSANIKMFVKNRSYNIKEGSMIFINTFELHKILYLNEKNYDRYVLYFRKEFLDEILNLMGLERLLVQPYTQTIIPLQKRILIESLLEELLEQFKENKITLSSNLQVLLLTILVQNEKCQELSVQHTKISSVFEETAIEILSYIDENFCKSLTLSQLEKTFSYSKFYLSRIIKNYTGFTFVDYLQYKRVAEAKKRLLKNEENITSILYSCGFNNAPHFCRVFKKLVGETPSEYRKRFQIL